MEKYPKVFVVLLSYNRKNRLKKCLDSLFKVDYPNYSVVVVDNNSTDGSLEMAMAGYSRSVFIRNEENLGYAAGNNTGIKYALERGADYILLLNNDTEVRVNFLKKLIELAESDPKIGIVSPLIFDGYSGKVWFSGGKIDWLKMKTSHKSEIKTWDDFDTDFISGCSMMVKKEVFGKIGLLDEDFYLYWEDADFSFRAKKAGFKIGVAMSSWIDHFERKDNETVNKVYWLVLSGLIFFKKNTPSAVLKLWIALYTFFRKIKNLIDVEFRKSKNSKLVQKAYGDFNRLQI
jgi:GT2 family glycosyltransferase